MMFIKYFIFALLLIPSISASQIIVVNKSVNKSTITESELRQIFRMRKVAWEDSVSNGNHISVFIQVNDSVLFYRLSDKMMMTPWQLRNTWDILQYSSSGSRPVELPSIEEMISAILKTSGAIGYLPDEYESKIDDLGLRQLNIIER